MLRIGVLSSEKHWIRQLAAIFPEWEMQVEDLSRGRLSAGVTDWDALVVDLEAIGADATGLESVVEAALSRSRYLILLIPHKLLDAEKQFSGKGIFILHKPTSVGELALALRMLFKET